MFVGKPELLLKSRSSVVLSLSPGFRCCDPDSLCSPLLVPRCAGVLLAPRHSPGDLRLLQHPGVSELASMFLMGNSEEEAEEEEKEAEGKEAASDEHMKLMALQERRTEERRKTD